MKVNRSQLLQALELVSSGLSSREMLDQANSFCFDQKKVFTYNDEICAIMPSPLDITGAIPSDPLREILNKLQEEILDVTQANGEVLFRGKGQRTALRYDPKIELPMENLETPTKWKPLPERFSEAIKLVESCAGKDDSNFPLTCVHLHPEWIEAFDTYQYSRFTMKLGIKKEMLVRQVSIKHLVDLEMKEFAETPQWLHFRNPTGMIMAIRRYTDKYPGDLHKIGDVSGKKIQFPKGLADVAERAGVFSLVRAQDNHDVRVDLKPGWVSIKGEGNYGWYRGRKKISYSGPMVSFMLHPNLLAQLVKKHSECQICTGKIMALKAELGDFTFVASLSDPSEADKKEKEQKIIKKGNKDAKSTVSKSK